MTQNSTAAKPALNDESFTRLLEAAYILQEHHDRPGQRVAPEEFPQIVNSILEIQRQTQSLQIDLSSALALIAAKLCEFTGAAGATVGRVEQSKMHYLVGTGTAAVLADSSISVDATSSSACVRTGKSVRSLATEADNRLNLVLCRRLGAKSFLAVPVFRNGNVDGVVELFFSRMNAFGEIEIRTAELMAGIAGEVLTQQAEHELKQELAAERESVLSVLEKLKPQLQRLAGEDRTTEKDNPAPKVILELCRACGQPLPAGESSCQHCGASRVTGKYPGAELQSKWAALWERQMLDVEHGPSFRKAVPNAAPADPILEGDPDHNTELPEFEHEGPPEDSGGVDQETKLVLVHGGLNPPSEETEFQSLPAPDSPAQLWARRLRKRAGDISLAAAASVFVVVLIWGLSSRPVANARAASLAGSRHKRPSAPQLSLLERALVSLGLAVPPPTPEYFGDPNVKVWVDLQTGLYYCPGVPLYGSTPKGRYSSQSDAQQDQFEPAARTPCD